MGFLSELRRRNVFRMAALYLVAAWLIMQVAEVVIGLANLPDWIGPLILALLAVGLPIALVLSWFYELTPEGITLDEDVPDAVSARHVRARRIDVVVIAMLVAAVLMFAYDKWWPDEVLEKSIAVLAFDNMSGDPAQEYFSDGISEELLNVLAQVPDLRVTSRSSSFSFKNQNVPISEVAEQLGVAYVLEGSVRKSGDRIRVTAQLIDAASDKHLWSENYDRDLDDLFAVQDDIASRICDALRVKLVLASGEEAAPAVVRSAELTAYDAYLQGREILRLRMPRRYQEADELFRQALRIDPLFAPAHAQIAIAVILAGEYYEWPGMRESAVEHLDKAEELDPDLAELHGGRALFANRFDKDYEAGVAHATRALELNPDYADAMNWLRYAYARLGRYEEADRVLDRMLVVDPLGITTLGAHSDRLVASGRFAEAHDVADKLITQSKAHGYHAHVQASLYRQGNIAEALYWALRLGEELGYSYSFVWQALALVGEYGEVRRLTEAAETYIAWLEGDWDALTRSSGGTLEEPSASPVDAFFKADTFYWIHRFEEALPLYERFFDSGKDGRLPDAQTYGPEFERVPVMALMRLGETRRRVGHEGAARESADIARREQEKLRAAGRNNNNRDIAAAMIAAFDEDHEAAFSALRAAVRNGLRAPYFRDPVFDNLRSHPEMSEIAGEMRSLVEQEHARVLQLICFENPTPDAWRPLPATCEDVENRPSLLEFDR